MSDVHRPFPPHGMKLAHTLDAASLQTQRVVIAYDVPDARRRRRLARAIVGRTPRIQQSVYEGDLTAEELRALAHELRRLADAADDRVLIAPLCRRCAAQRLWVGADHLRAPSGDGTIDWRAALDAAQLVVA